MEGDNNNDNCDVQLPTIDGIDFVNYVNEEQLEDVMRLVGQDLSEPYSIFTYRYFLHRWPQLCILAVPTNDDDGDEDKDESNNKKSRRPIGCVVCKIDIEDGDSDETAAAVSEITSNTLLRIDQSTEDKNNNANNNDDNNITPLKPLPNNKVYTGYIGMLAVSTTHRRSGIGTALVQRSIHRMKAMGCQSIRLETEVTNKAAMKLYEDRLGFVREELLKKYYLNWGDAYRLRLWLV